MEEGCQGCQTPQILQAGNRLIKLLNRKPATFHEKRRMASRVETGNQRVGLQAQRTVRNSEGESVSPDDYSEVLKPNGGNHKFVLYV